MCRSKSSLSETKGVERSRDLEAAIWKSAEGALVRGDDTMLAHLLRVHEHMFRTEQPQSEWLGGLTPDYKSGDARSIIAGNHFFKDWNNFAEFAGQLREPTSPMARFERAVDAVVSGD